MKKSVNTQESVIAPEVTTHTANANTAACGMSGTTQTVAQQRGYIVETTTDAKLVAQNYLTQFEVMHLVTFGLPEIDDRYHIWRIPLKKKENISIYLGEVVIDGMSGDIDYGRSTVIDIISKRAMTDGAVDKKRKPKKIYRISTLNNQIALGDCVTGMDSLPEESVDLIFTSPPYFNARPQYSEYHEYQEYLDFMRKVIVSAARVLHEGRFFVINIAPILLRRTSRSESSRRIAVPYDIHSIFIEEGFEFIDDIIWVKPSGAGWATGRGRRFFADRNPLQYKAVPVTEYLLVFRKKSDLLIDWFIRNHPNQKDVLESKIEDGYESTNVWKINPQTRSKHPAPFPQELARKVIQYYSFKNDVVLDPFAGSGTTGLTAYAMNRRFLMYEISSEYMKIITDAVATLPGLVEATTFVGVDPPEVGHYLFHGNQENAGPT